jgi:hypothetical protein
MSFFTKNRASFFFAFIFAIYTIFTFGIYEVRTLNGDINNHILSGDMFGVPEALKARGIKPLYYGAGNTGWDGQFYYYISNDILALKDTSIHIDAPSYRYQRVGLSLYVATISTLLGNSWVSPATFLISYFFLVLIATFVGARLLMRFGANPALILLWSLSIGTQITLFNALPDAAADAFLILALGAVFAGRIKLSIIPFVLSGLSREVYVLFPSFILLFYYFNSFWTASASGAWNNYYWLLLPGLAAVFWNIYITRHFGISPSSQAHGILGLPLVAWMEYFISGLHGNHKLIGPGMYAYAEAGSLALFLLVLGTSFWISGRVIKDYFPKMSPEVGGVALATICFSFLYICFGPTVIMHYTGYFKALAIFFFIIPLLLASARVTLSVKIIIYALLIISLLFTTIYNMKARILPAAYDDDKYTNMRDILINPRVECFGTYDAEIKVNMISVNSGSAMSHFFGRGDQVTVDLELKNTGNNTFWSIRNFGSVFMSYQWVDSKGNVIQDGIRSAISGGLLPGQSKPITVVSNMPVNPPDDISMMLSPVQEGCAWFYLGNPKFSGDVKLKIKKQD